MVAGFLCFMPFRICPVESVADHLLITSVAQSLSEGVAIGQDWAEMN